MHVCMCDVCVISAGWQGRTSVFSNKYTVRNFSIAHRWCQLLPFSASFSREPLLTVSFSRKFFWGPTNVVRR